MKNYQEFKATLMQVKADLASKGVNITFKKWRKESPYQKARYRAEYVFPEVWAYRADGGSGAVITGEDITTNTKQTAELIRNYLY
jgi:lipid A disaccharide synthetase